MKKIVMYFLFMGMLFANCNKELFTLKIQKPIPFSSVLSSIAYKCNLTIIPLDKKSSSILNSSINFINLKNVTLKALLDTLFDSKNLFYTLKNNKLYISFFKTKTFFIDYISNTITGSTNLTDKDNKLNSNYSFVFWSNLEKNIKMLLKNSDSFYKEPIIDKNAAIVTVTGTKRQLKEVSKYIKKIKNELHKEVLIDVKIYSVELSNSHKTGIDWSKLSLSLPSTSVPLRASYLAGSQSIFNSATFNSEAFLNFLAQYGNVNSISNPKIVTLNNQKAIISIGTTIYYKYASSITNQANTQSPQTQYTIDSKFVGILLDITPQISNEGDIILNINPRISAFKDPTQLNAQSRDMPPDIKLNTLMSVVRLKNNQTLVLGGLISTDNSFKINGVPILKEIPLIKYLFSSKEQITNRKELVFVITPHIINLNKTKSLKDLGYSKLPSLEDIDE